MKVLLSSILTCLLVNLASQSLLAENSVSFSRSDAKEVSKLSDMLLGAVSSHFSQPNPEVPQLLNEFKLDPLQKKALLNRVKKLKKDLKRVVKRKQKRTLRKNAPKKGFRSLRLSSSASQDEGKSEDSSSVRCISLCAWASAWAHASCTAKACAQCPRGIIRVCGYSRASATAYAFGNACVSRCKEVKKPKC